MANVVKFRIGTVSKGEYSPTGKYVNLDEVQYLGSSYRCKSSVEITGVLPTDTNAWDLMSAKGDKGDQGIKGETGEKGEKGDTGAQGEQGIQGIQGEPGITPEIMAEYASVAEMEADFATTVVTANNLCQIVTADKADEANGALYRKGAEAWIFTIDLVAPAIQGVKGDKGDDGVAGRDGADGLNGMSVTSVTFDSATGEISITTAEATAE